MRIDLKTSRGRYGGQDYSIVVDVTNVGDRPLSAVEVDPQLIPGTVLAEAESESTGALDELQESKRRILREMEEQVAAAYEKQRIRKLSFSERLILAYARMPDVIASMITGNRPRMFRIPYWASEATRLATEDDVQRVERDFIEKEDEESLLRRSFQADKEKLASVFKEIGGTPLGPATEAPRLLPGDTISFSFACRAPNLYRERSMDCQFRVSYQESETAKVSTTSAGESLSFYASPFAVPLGAVTGALVGYIVKTSLMSSAAWFTRDFFVELAGSIALAVIVAYATARSPDKKKMFTVEDFFGGFVIGAIAAMFSVRVIEFLQGLVPQARP